MYNEYQNRYSVQYKITFKYWFKQKWKTILIPILGPFILAFSYYFDIDWEFLEIKNLYGLSVIAFAEDPIVAGTYIQNHEAENSKEDKWKPYVNAK